MQLSFLVAEHRTHKRESRSHHAMETLKPRPLTCKPDLPEAARRWEAYFAGEMLDRPIVCVTAPKHGPLPPWEYRYRQKVFGDMDEIIDEALARAEATYYAGEAIPS